jgi:uncharacterized membrane protein
METFVSKTSGITYPISERIIGLLISPSILSLIRKEFPDFQDTDCISIQELAIFREKYMVDFLHKEMGELNSLEKKVLDSLNEKTSLTDIAEESSVPADLTYGQRLADKVASFGGSWTFIISFGIFILIWIIINIVFLSNKSFDPYPFILLNLILSCIASLQAPVIMMSQNRQEEKDRERAKKDYMINLKSELEIRILHEKIDHLMLHQQQDLIEIQKVQIDMMNDILKNLKK